MSGDLPQLLLDDLQQIEAAVTSFLTQTEAELVLLTAQGGFLIAHFGRSDACDHSTLGALASNAYEANRAIASIIGEPHFNSIYQQGQTSRSLYIQSIDGFNLLIIIFPLSISVGIIKYYVTSLRDAVAAILDQARLRQPGQGLDLAMMNLPDSEALFKRKN